MTIDTIPRIRAILAKEGFTESLVARGGELFEETSGTRHAPRDLTVIQLIRFHGITSEEEEGLLFVLATADRTPLGTYAPTDHATASAADAAIVEELQTHVISEREIKTHDRHDHIAAVFDDRTSAQAVVDELRQLGLGSDAMGAAVRDGTSRIFERRAETDVLHNIEVGAAAGAAIGLLAGVSLAAVVLVPGGLVGLGGILALGVPGGLWGAFLGGYLGEAATERADFERQELTEVPLESDQVLVAACSHGHAQAVADVMERHGGELLLRRTDQT